MEWLQYLLLLICPLMMISMMMMGHGGHGGKQKHNNSHSPEELNIKMSRLELENQTLKKEIEALSTLIRKES